MAAPRSTAAHASVVFLKIPEFAQHPIAEQVRLKGLLEGAMAVALACLREAERIVLEAADGAAVVVLGNPAAALEFARRSSAGEKAVPIAAGISHGPVRVASGSSSPIVLGDGIVSADALAAFAPRGRVAATREFRDALARVAPGDAAHLAPRGTHSDAHDRSYEVFLADEQAAIGRRRSLLLLGGAACTAIVAMGVAARFGLRNPMVAAKSVDDAGPPTTPVEAVQPTQTAQPDRTAAHPPQAAQAETPPSKAAPAPLRLATVRLDIKPRGQVYIDGVAKGSSPPLSSIHIAPGKHRIEIRHGRATPLVLQLHAGPGEELAIKHTFSPPPAQQPKPAWRRWLDKLK